jgi:hypothetical protein
MHKHKAKAKDTTITGWTHCVVGSDCDGSAHGNVVRREVCACGAVRLVESNDGHEARSEWDDPDGSEVCK